MGCFFALTAARPALPDENIIKKTPMVSVPSGNFTMGSNEYDNEKPAHTVSLGEYAMDKY